MISRLGDIFIAGAGIANQIYFLFILTLFGINSGGGHLYRPVLGMP
jgi:Na+-driven multidrug efflux pump